MILQRLSKAIRNQNWSQIITEILIVVIGIFLGLQVQEWNEGRKDIQRERQYLKRISAELREDIEQYNGVIEASEERLAYGEFLLASLKDEALVRDKPRYFIEALNMAGNTLRVYAADNTFEEIKYSGDFQIIRNVDLRDQIAKYYDKRDHEEQWNFLREEIQTTYYKQRAGILKPEHYIFRNLPEDIDITIDDALLSYGKFKERQSMIDWIATVINFKRGDNIMASESLSEVEKLVNIIENELSK